MHLTLLSRRARGRFVGYPGKHKPQAPCPPTVGTMTAGPDEPNADSDDDRDPDPDVVVEAGTMDDAGAAADLWVELARGQRAHGSHLLPDENRSVARDAVARAVVSGGLYVARVEGDVASGGPDSAAERGVVGFVTCGSESGSYEQDVKRGTVYNLYVRPAYREMGIGTRLLERAEASLAEAGVDTVALEAMAANEDARRFYARHGYDLHRVELERSLDADGSDSD